MRRLHAVTRDDEPEAGFTLIELMMVVLIIAILIAVLIPTFVGAKSRAQDRAVQSSVRNALIAARVIFSDHGDYTEATLAALTATEPSIGFVDATTTPANVNTVSVEAVSTTYFVAAGQSKSAACFFVRDDESVGGTGERYAKATSGACSASAAPAANSPSWGATW
jgi:type IV pilus assembly protein PilA